MLSVIIVPILAAVATFVVARKSNVFAGYIAVAASFANLFLAYSLYGVESSFSMPWAGWFFEISLKSYQFSTFILISTAVFGALLSVYNTVFLKEKAGGWLFHAYFLLTIGFVNGAVLANNLLLMLFFWEGLLVIMFGMIYLGGREAYKTASKMVMIAGVADICMMFGIGLAIFLTQTATISSMKVSMTGLGGLAFVLLVIGAVAKAGSMPFHSWIPDAASNAPMPFLPLIPAALEKLLGIYFLARITLDIFELNMASWGSTLLMVVGVCTIILAVSMALIQKEYKRLLSYHAISQVGYMILGIGTCTPAGVVGGLFHMINHTIYKCCLFLTSGAVEHQAGTTELKSIGGLGRKMPITFVIFIIAAASISGVPPFNGFFSKELVYAGAMERGEIFWILAVIGSVLTAASFLKLGHAAYVDKRGDTSNVKEAPIGMLLPGIILAGLCVFFGVGFSVPLREFIQPILGAQLGENDFSHFHFDFILVGGTVVALTLAVINHFIGVKRSGSGLGASDHIRYAPVLRPTYGFAEKCLDPYDIVKFFGGIVAYVGWFVDRAIDFFYDRVVTCVALWINGALRLLHNGNHVTYLAWSLAGLLFVIIACMSGRL